MNRNIRLLEERVLQATKRLRQLSDDRTVREQEVQSLRDRLETVEKAEAVDSGAASVWDEERTRVVSAVRQALTELQGNSSS